MRKNYTKEKWSKNIRSIQFKVHQHFILTYKIFFQTVFAPIFLFTIAFLSGLWPSIKSAVAVTALTRDTTTAIVTTTSTIVWIAMVIIVWVGIIVTRVTTAYLWKNKTLMKKLIIFMVRSNICLNCETTIHSKRISSIIQFNAT